MRFCFTIIVAGLILFGPARECQAQSSQGQRTSVNDLKAAFTTEPKLTVEQIGSGYYDVIVENVCNGPVANLTSAWLREWSASYRNRAIEISAKIAFPDSNRSAFDSLIFIGSNIVGPQWSGPCKEDAIVRGVPRDQKVQITLQLIVVDELGQRTTAVLAGAVTAGITALTTAWSGPVGFIVGVVGGVVVAGTKAYADQSKKVSQQLLQAGGKIFTAHPVDIGGVQQKNKVATTVAGASYVSNGQELFSLRRKPRPQLLEVPSLMFSSKIPEQINLVSVHASWDDMLKAAHFDTVDWSVRRSVNNFCTSFRRELQSSLQYDTLAVSLGLYANFVMSQTFKGDPDRAKWGCLESKDLTNLRESGYLPTFGF